MSYNRPAKTQLSHEEHLEHASKTHGVGYGKPEEEVTRDEEGVARGSTPRPTSGGQTSDEETKGPLSDKKNVSIPEAVEDDLNKSPERIDYEMASPDGEGKEPPSDESKTDKGSSGGEGEQKKSESDSKEKSSDESKTDKGSSDDEGKQKQSGSNGKETKPSDEKNADKNKGNSSGEGKQKQSGSDGKEKPSNSDGESNEMDDSHESVSALPTISPSTQKRTC
jgi:penicillin-binding protein 1A